MIVRSATLADLDQVAASETEAFAIDAWSPALIEEGLRDQLPTVRYLVAEDAAPGASGRVVGHAVASFVDDVVELQRIATRATHRRRGVAGQLLQHVLALAEAAGARRMLLEVREDNVAALAFYRRHRFVELDRRPRYYRDGAAAIVLVRPCGAGADLGVDPGHGPGVEPGVGPGVDPGTAE